ncbi:MAG: hypothetical protein LC750_17595, partial [Actinobacteria bacterium]|nr:hypothetical protein [Actinomycetota bacterium]
MLSTRTGTARGILGIATKLLLLALAILVVMPNLAFAETTIKSVETQDSNHDGHIDHLVVTFNAAPDCAATCSFSISGTTYSIKGTSHSADNTVYTLELDPIAAYDTAATPSVVWNGAPTTSADKASPILVSATGDDLGTPLVFNYLGDTMTIQFSEPITLQNSVNPTSPTVPATTQQDISVALEHLLTIGPSGCGDDGDGVTKRNFPAVNPQTPTSVPFTFSADKKSVTITQVTAIDGSTSGSGTNGHFSINPTLASVHCTAAINGTYVANVIDNSPAKNFSFATVPGININHVKGVLSGDPTTGDSDLNGKIDTITFSLSHKVKLDSVQAALLQNVIAIVDGETSATNITCAACATATPATPGATSVTLSFTPDASWNTATVPTLQYTGGSACVLKVELSNPAFTECSEDFQKASIDKAAPVLLSAKTLDVAAPGANGKLDGVELYFSEPVSDDAFSGATPAGWAVTGYSVNGSSTGSAANDAVARLLFAEVSVDTDKAAPVAYTVPTGAREVPVKD